MKKIFNILLTISFIMIFTISPDVYAKDKSTSEITIVDVYQPEESSEPAKIEFVDKKLENNKKSKSFSTQGEIYEVYDHSYYVYGSQTLRQYDVGPMTNQTFLISVAKGETLTLSNSVTVSGTVSYSYSVEAGIKSVINTQWTGSASGTISKTWGTTETYTGPSETSPYNSRNYYSAAQYDLYNVTVKKYDVYKVYNGGIYYGTQTYYVGSQTVNDVKKPKIIKYSIDTNY